MFILLLFWLVSEEERLKDLSFSDNIQKEDI